MAYRLNAHSATPSKLAAPLFQYKPLFQYNFALIILIALQQADSSCIGCAHNWSWRCNAGRESSPFDATCSPRRSGTLYCREIPYAQPYAPRRIVPLLISTDDEVRQQKSSNKTKIILIIILNILIL
ncbi:MAG: hypothetical protein ACR5LF_12490 [Symbiopectobacterium sp.]